MFCRIQHVQNTLSTSFVSMYMMGSFKILKRPFKTPKKHSTSLRTLSTRLLHASSSKDCACFIGHIMLAHCNIGRATWVASQTCVHDVDARFIDGAYTPAAMRCRAHCVPRHLRRHRAHDLRRSATRSAKRERPRSVEHPRVISKTRTPACVTQHTYICTLSAAGTALHIEMSHLYISASPNFGKLI